VCKMSDYEAAASGRCYTLVPGLLTLDAWLRNVNIGHAGKLRVASLEFIKKRNPVRKIFRQATQGLNHTVDNGHRHHDFHDDKQAISGRPSSSTLGYCQKAAKQKGLGEKRPAMS